MRENYEFLWNGENSVIRNSRIKDTYPTAKSILSVAYAYGKIKYPEKLTKHVGRAYQARCYRPPKESVNGQRFEMLKNFIRSNGIDIIENITLPERAVAARAGVITYGKNDFGYVDGAGSFVILSSIVMDCELTCDESTVFRKCPDNCRRCIDACPTGAIIGTGNWIHINVSDTIIGAPKNPCR